MGRILGEGEHRCPYCDFPVRHAPQPKPDISSDPEVQLLQDMGVTVTQEQLPCGAWKDTVGL